MSWLLMCAQKDTFSMMDDGNSSKDMNLKCVCQYKLKIMITIKRKIINLDIHNAILAILVAGDYFLSTNSQIDGAAMGVL